MFLEGEVDWVLVLGLVAAVTSILAVTAVVYAFTHRTRHVSTADELGAVSRAREAAETRLYETLNAIPVAIVQTDRGGKFVFANRAAHQLMGRRDAELIGLRFHSATWGITYPDGRPVPPDLLPSARALRGQTVKGFQHILANPATRRKMLVSVTAMPIEDSLGQIIGSTAAIVETEGLTTPDALPVETAPAPNGTDDLTRRVFEAAASALVVVAANGVIREANPMALSLFGRDAGVIGTDFADQFLGETERVEGRQTLRAALAATPGEADPIESRFGGERGVTWRILPLSAPGEAVDALLLAGTPGAAPAVEVPVEAPVVEPEAHAADDAVALARAAEAAAVAREAALARTLDQVQAELQAAHDAAASAAARARAEVAERNEAAHRLESVGRLTGGVAQDFNALLAVMTSALDMMLKTADDPARVRRLGQAALIAGQRGEALTRRLSAFSAGEAAQGQVLDPGVLVRGLETRLRTLAGPGIDLMIEAPERETPVLLDPVAFDATVTGLVRNAAEAMDGAGSIAVRLEPGVDGGIRLSVRDTGPGLTPATAQRALEPFFTTRVGAQGLGLTQAHAFARQWGGTLTLTGAEGQGAEAVLTLPGVVAEQRLADSAA
ncbi:PAS domain-containing sensor histidine kinase [Brevundimonas subvibrioides]|uniref:histidine kinase n=1 Tax=Brevundimonas subvibrioides (strain ATCC 15264 / DSM 4735 / LMG 14903 / NBRC 16000 / CB 81) TaxID=633149 RepID=D9QKN8_BRESC|nr:PAS domain-containing sensor histidine kinase [Brevundimonas subvibrioides]ADK99863.1 PAS/PAC sensor signal transduction histidine kinase [Brevundimonas subvibrioides ATCC 15264]